MTVEAVSAHLHSNSALTAPASQSWGNAGTGFSSMLAQSISTLGQEPGQSGNSGILPLSTLTAALDFSEDRHSNDRLRTQTATNRENASQQTSPGTAATLTTDISSPVGTSSQNTPVAPSSSSTGNTAGGSTEASSANCTTATADIQASAPKPSRKAGDGKGDRSPATSGNGDQTAPATSGGDASGNSSVQTAQEAAAAVMAGAPVVTVPPPVISGQSAPGIIPAADQSSSTADSSGATAAEAAEPTANATVAPVADATAAAIAGTEATAGATAAAISGTAALAPGSVANGPLSRTTSSPNTAGQQAGTENPSSADPLGAEGGLVQNAAAALPPITGSQTSNISIQASSSGASTVGTTNVAQSSASPGSPVLPPAALAMAQAAALGQSSGATPVSVKTVSGNASSTIPPQSSNQLAPAAAVYAANADVTAAQPATPSGAAPSVTDDASNASSQTASADPTQNQDTASGFAPLLTAGSPNLVAAAGAGASSVSAGETLSAPGALTGALNSSADAKSASPIDPVIAAPLAASQGFAQIQEGVAAEASQTARPLAQPNPVDQIKVQLSKSLKDGADTLSVQLHPEDLGRVEVKLEMQNGQVKATVTADRPETLQMLKNDSSSLQQSLNNAGLNTDANSLSFHLRGEQQQQQRQASENGSGGFSNGRNEAPEDDIPDATLASNTALSWTTGGGNGIDINV